MCRRMYGETKRVSVMDVRTDCFTDNGVAFSFKCIVFGYFLFTYTEKYLRVKERIYIQISVNQ